MENITVTTPTNRREKNKIKEKASSIETT